VDDLGILPHLKDTAGNVHLRSYFQYAANHALSNAHHLRELAFIVGRYHQAWATGMIEWLVEIKEMVEQVRVTQDHLSPDLLCAFEARSEALLG